MRKRAIQKYSPKFYILLPRIVGYTFRKKQKFSPHLVRKIASHFWGSGLHYSVTQFSTAVPHRPHLWMCVLCDSYFTTLQPRSFSERTQGTLHLIYRLEILLPENTTRWSIMGCPVSRRVTVRSTLPSSRRSMSLSFFLLATEVLPMKNVNIHPPSFIVAIKWTRWFLFCVFHVPYSSKCSVSRRRRMNLGPILLQFRAKPVGSVGSRVGYGLSPCDRRSHPFRSTVDLRRYERPGSFISVINFIYLSNFISIGIFISLDNFMSG